MPGRCPTGLRALGVVSLAAALSACASTVQTSASDRLAGTGAAAADALSVPTAAPGTPAATVSGSGTGPSSSVTTTINGGTTVTGSAVTAPAAIPSGGSVPEQPRVIDPKLPPLRLGYTITDLTGAKGSFGGAGNFDTDAQEQASVDMAKALIRYANRTGGVGGRRIVGYQTTVSTADGVDENRRTARCVSATEDQHVDAMIGTDSFFGQSDVGCFAAHRTPLLAILHSISERFVLANRPYLATTFGAPERTEAALVDGAARAGFFRGATVGAIVDDEPTIRRIYDQVVIPRLARIGVKVVATHYLAPTNPGTQASEGQSAVLDFKSKHVNKVLVLANVLSLIGFANAEQTADYHPQLALGDYQIVAFAGAAPGNTQTFSSLGPAMKGAIGVTVYRNLIRDDPAATSGSDIPKDRKVIGTGAKRCLDVLSKEMDVDYYKLPADHQGRNWGSFCDEFFLWLDAARRVGPAVTRETWGAGLAAIRDTYDPVTVHRAYFDNAHFNGALDYHVGRYYDPNPGCGCYKNLFPGRYFTLPG